MVVYWDWKVVGAMDGGLVVVKVEPSVFSTVASMAATSV
jgi:hypothetical protein